MEETEKDKQLQASTQFINISVEESKNFKEGGLNYKASADIFKTLYEQHEKLVRELIPAKIPAEVTDETLAEMTKVISEAASNAAKKGVESTQCKVPSDQKLADAVAKLIMDKIAPEIDESVKTAVNKHRAKINVEHTHYNAYCRYANTERNRKIMCWLGFITSISIIQMILLLLDMYSVIDWDFKIFVWSFVITIIAGIAGFIYRVTRKE